MQKSKFIEQKMDWFLLFKQRIPEAFFGERRNMRAESKWLFQTSEDSDVLEEVITEELVDKEKDLIVYNDDVNTFDHVIECLETICNHNSIQAEQCTYIIHYSGKCTVENGSFNELKPMCLALLDKGLSASIE